MEQIILIKEVLDHREPQLMEQINDNLDEFLSVLDEKK